MLSPGTYILFGRTGVGKSSLINTISGKPLASTNAFQACTSSVEKYQFSRPSGQYIFYDSPGLFEDEDDETDLNYLRSISGLLINELLPLGLDSAASIVLVTRLHSSRLRSEDYGVYDYFCRLLNQFPRLKPIQIFTFADVTAPSFFDDLLRARARSSVVCDYQFSLSEFTDWVSPVFKEFYAVDNLQNLWISSSNYSIDLSPIFSADDMSNEFESMVGLPWEFLRKWYKSAPYRFPDSGPEFFKCLVNRIFNISTLSDNVLLPDPWLQSHTSSQPNQDSDHPSVESGYKATAWVGVGMPFCLFKAEAIIKSYFYVKSSVELDKLKKTLPDRNSELITPLWYYYSSSSGESEFLYLIFLLQSRYTSLSLYSIVRSGNLREVSGSRLHEILHKFRSLYDFSLIHNESVCPLLEGYVDYMLLLRESSQLSGDDLPCINAHLVNASTILFLSTYFLEWIDFPDHPRVCFDEVLFDFSSLALWIKEFLRIEKSPNFSAMSTIYSLFCQGNLEAIASIDHSGESGLRLFVKYLLAATNYSVYMISSKQSNSVLADYFCEKYYVPSDAELRDDFLSEYYCNKYEIPDLPRQDEEYPF